MSGDEMDFGKEIIPGLLGKKKLSAYIFDGYWEDIGTVGAFFEANLALTDEVPDFDFYKPSQVVYTHSRFLPGSKIFDSKIVRSNISDGCIINNSTIQRSVIGIRSIIRNGCNLKNVVMMGSDYYETIDDERKNIEKSHPSLGIGQNCSIENAIIDKNARIGDNCRITPFGKPDKWESEGLYVRDGVIIVTKNAVIPPNTQV